MTTSQQSSMTKQLDERLKAEQVICFIRYSDKEFKGKTAESYPLVALYTAEEFYNHNKQVALPDNVRGETSLHNTDAALDTTLVIKPSPTTEVERELNSSTAHATPTTPTNQDKTNRGKDAATSTSGDKLPTKRTLHFSPEIQKTQLGDDGSDHTSAGNATPAEVYGFDSEKHKGSTTKEYICILP